jgi:hypothetical protein
MARSMTFHSALGGADFVGVRQGRSGDMEIVYDDGVARRLVWRVAMARPDLGAVREALSRAVTFPRVVPALHAELKRRSIPVEIIVSA